MDFSLGHLSMLFAAGCVGGLANGIAVWFFGKAGISKAMGVQIAPEWSLGWLYPRLVWGGLWGFLFVLPYFQDMMWWMRGVVFSLAPTLFVLFYVFPKKMNRGMMGLELGKLTPVFAFLVNAVWGIATLYWLQLIS